jgi:hypothetical protein
MDLLPQQPQIQGFVIYRGQRHSRIALLLMKTIQCFQKVQLGSRRRLNGVEALKTSLEAEVLSAKTTVAVENSLQHKT